MKKVLAIAVFGVLCMSTFAHAQYAGTGTTQLSLTVGAEAAIAVTNASTPLTATGTIFNNYTGTTNFTYKIRTTQTGGTGTLTAYVSSDFTAATNGPSVASPPNAGDLLKLTCTVTGGSSPCSAATATTNSASATQVASWGADAHANGSAGSVAWTLVNDPIYPTGSYTATVTFTISAT